VHAENGRHRPVVIVGGGQAGLSMSYCLTQRGVEHVVLERDRVAQQWRSARWDSFCLVTPNWQCRLPGFPYAGDDPHGFMVREQILDYLRAYAASFRPPVREGVTVTGLSRDGRGGYLLRTADGDSYTAGQVVVATGAYHRPVVPEYAPRLPEGVTQLHSSQYQAPGQLPDGAVLVVGSGQSGAQIAEDLHLAGRAVHLSVGSAPRVARSYRGRDVVAWLDELGYYDMPITRHPRREGVRAQANHYVTGRGGGRDIDLRAFAAAGMCLHGRLVDVRGGQLRFAADLRANLDHADQVSESIKDTIDDHIRRTGADAPAEPRYRPIWQPPPGDEPLDLAGSGITGVIWAIGFRSDYRWVDVPVFTGTGYPAHTRGVTSAPGLYFLGLPWLWTWGSGRFSGIARDAEYLTEQICSGRGTPYATAGALAGAPAGLPNALALGS
jgi:putative flavoprotein involved in K+ transport